MCRALYLAVFVILNYILSYEAARILGVFPTPSISHQVAFRPLMQELVNRGHEVTVITTDPMYPKEESPKNLTEIDVHDISYAEWGKFVSLTSGKKNNLCKQMMTAFELMTIIFEKQVQTDEVQRMIRNKDIQFDLIFAEAMIRESLVFSHVYKAPVIQISSLGPMFDSFHIMGAPSHPLLYPVFTHKRIYNLTLWEKVIELYDYYWMIDFYHNHEKVDNDMLRRNFGADVPRLSELYDNVQMLFLNTHQIWGDNTPVPPSVIYMGGVHQNPEKSLPQELKDYLDSSANGVIYMSFGTNTNPSSLPPEKIQLFVRVFSQLPYNILWKWDKDVLPGQTKNIRIGKWFPQSDLLRHPKIKLFIMQGGLQSTDEAIAAGVPLLGIPMLGDQWYNVEKYVHHKIGIHLDLETLTEEQFRIGIEKIIEDNSYRDNVVRLRTLIHDQPLTPLQRAVWWTEHVLRHNGAAHLRAPAANMQWTRYYEIELVLTLLGSFFLFVFLCVFLVFQLYEWMKRNFRAKIKFQ